MDIFEAIKVFFTPRLLLGHIQQPTIEEKQRANEEWVLFQNAEEIIVDSMHYRTLTAQEGHTVALAALELFDIYRGREDYEYLPHHILTNLANVVPGALEGLYSQLLERDLAWDSDAMFREADSSTRDSLISLIEEGVEHLYKRADLLCALAWIGDETVQKTFYRWRTSPPPGSLPPETYAREAGWELTEDGKRCNLYYPENYDLIAMPTSPPAPVAHTAQVNGTHVDVCHWCGRQLLVLFDINLSDPKIAFLRAEGSRIPVALCVNCSLQDANVYIDIARDGTFQWSMANGEKPPRLRINGEEDINLDVLSRLQFVLGEKRPLPYESQGSHLGGCPEWIQGNDYPRCPICQQTMMFIGQLEPHVEYVEGIIYAFLCPLCEKATTVYQQT